MTRPSATWDREALIQNRRVQYIWGFSDWLTSCLRCSAPTGYRWGQQFWQLLIFLSNGFMVITLLPFLWISALLQNSTWIYDCKVWQKHGRALTNICDNFDKNLCLHHHCVQRRSNRLRKTRTVVVPAEVDPWTIASWYPDVIFMWLINTLVDGCVTDLVVISPDVGWALLVQRHGHGDQ